METTEQAQVTRPDFPKTLNEFTRRFHADAACREYLEASRWPRGFTCPTCGSRKAYRIESRNVHQCENGHQTSATAGTVMHKSKVSLPTWFWGAYMVTTHTPGISATQLARQLDLRYETAYMMLQRLRAGMVNPHHGKLLGRVQIDETYVGGRSKGGKRGRGASGKAIVLGAVEQRPGGRLRLMVVRSVRADTLGRFIEDNIEPGSTLVTDRMMSYLSAVGAQYTHEAVESPNAEQDSEALKLVHRVFGNLKTWLLGTHHGRVMPKHLQAYLNEFVFRFNRRVTPMAAFQTALGIGSRVQGPTYDGIYGGTWKHPQPASATA